MAWPYEHGVFSLEQDFCIQIWTATKTCDHCPLFSIPNYSVILGY